MSDRAILRESKHSRHARVKDFAWYIGISCMVGSTVVVSALLGVNENVFMNIFTFLLLTGFVFGYFIQSSHSYWKRRPFWILSGLFFAAHCGAYVLLVLHFGRIKPAYFGAALFELFGFIGLRERYFAAG